MFKTAIATTLLACALTATAHDGDAPAQSSPTAPLTVAVQTGQGANAYTTVPNWGKVPNKDYIGSTHGGIVVDKAGLIYVSTNGDLGLCVFKEDGTFVKSFKNWKSIHGMNIQEENGKEYVYAAVMTHMVKLSLDGKVVMAIEGKAQGWGKATAVAVAPDGKIFVADGYGSSKIFVYDKNGKILKEFGTHGAGAGQFKTSQLEES